MCTKNNVYCTQVINQYYYCKNNLKAQFTSLSVWSLVSQSYWEIFTKEQFKIKQLWKLLRRTGFFWEYMLMYIGKQCFYFKSILQSTNLLFYLKSKLSGLERMYGGFYASYSVSAYKPDLLYIVASVFMRRCCFWEPKSRFSTNKQKWL